MVKLNHTHDCELCSYLGSFYSAKRGVAVDCHTCEGELILRFGSTGPEYNSLHIESARECVGLSADWKRIVDLYDAFVREAS